MDGGCFGSLLGCFPFSFLLLLFFLFVLTEIDRPKWVFGLMFDRKKEKNEGGRGKVVVIDKPAKGLRRVDGQWWFNGGDSVGQRREAVDL